MSKQNILKLLMLGAPGSGKTTLSKVLAQKFNLCLIKTGDMMRSYAASHHDDSMLKLLERGEMMDDEIVARIVRERIESRDCEVGLISDGYPRLISQLEVYDPQFNYAIYLRVPEKVLLERLRERGRTDDTDQAVKTRMEIFNQETMPVVEHYRKLNQLLEVDGVGSVEEVTDRIMKEFDNVENT